MLTVKQPNGTISLEGFTEYPMERMTYDPELDFETRQPDARDLLPEANDKLRSVAYE